MTVLRDYQDDIVTKVVDHVRAGRRRVLVQAATGSGKSVIIGELIKRAVAKGRRVVFIAHRHELNDQISERLTKLGIAHGIWVKGHWKWNPDLLVQVVSIQTLAKAEFKPEAAVVIVDEAHHMVAAQYRTAMKCYPQAALCGFSATPERLDGRGLGDIFEVMVCAPSMSELIAQNHLLPFLLYCPDTPDLSGVQTSHGDYNQQQLEQAVRSSSRRIGNMAYHYNDKAKDLAAIAFLVSIEDSKDVAQTLRNEGLAAEHIDGKMPKSERAAILQRLKDGVTKIVCNVQLWTEGVDVPLVNCVILGRPTQSLALYLQQVGRAGRPYGDQTHAIILDHAGCVHRHGRPEQPRKWTLEGRKRRKKQDASNLLQMCDKCGVVRSALAPFCPKCNPKKAALFPGPTEVEGDLSLYQDIILTDKNRCPECEGGPVRDQPTRAGYRMKRTCRECRAVWYAPDPDRAKNANMRQRLIEWRRLETVRMDKGFALGWSKHQYRETFGMWPPAEFVEKTRPGEPVNSGPSM